MHKTLVFIAVIAWAVICTIMFAIDQRSTPGAQWWAPRPPTLGQETRMTILEIKKNDDGPFARLLASKAEYDSKESESPEERENRERAARAAGRYWALEYPTYADLKWMMRKQVGYHRAARHFSEIKTLGIKGVTSEGEFIWGVHEIWKELHKETPPWR